MGFAGSFKKETGDQIKNEPEKKQKKSEKVLFKESGIGGGFDLFDDDDDDDFVKVKQSKAKESVVTNAKNVETEKVDFDPLANEISETQKDITPDAPKDAKSEIVKDTKEKNEKLAMFNDDNDAFGIASSENVIISKQKTLGPQKEELVDNEVDVQSHENVKEKVEENQNEKEEETKFKKPGKLADKFGHLNFDPTKMKVGAGPPKKTKEFVSGNNEEQKSQNDTFVKKKRKNTVDMEIDELFDFVPDDDNNDKNEEKEKEDVIEDKVQEKEPSPTPEIEQEADIVAVVEKKENVKEVKKATTNIFDDSSDDDVFSSNITKKKLKMDEDDFDSLFD